MSLQDIKDAVWTAKESFDSLRVDQVIPQNGYKITNVISKEYRNENIKVVVAEKSSTVIIAFMGSHG